MAQRSTVRKLQASVLIGAAASVALTETWTPMFTQLLGYNAAPPAALKTDVGRSALSLDARGNAAACAGGLAEGTSCGVAARALAAAAAVVTLASGVRGGRKTSRPSVVARQACFTAAPEGGIEAAASAAAMSAQFSFAGCSKAPDSAERTSRVTRHMLMPKTIRFKKPHKPVVKPFRHSSKWKFRGFAECGATPYFGKYALQALEEAWISSKQIENVRRAIVRTMERKGKIWIRVFPHNAITKRVAESRMGAGKGALEYWVAAVRPKFILFEIDGVSEDIARNAFRKASYRLPCLVKFIKKEDGPSRFESGFAGKPQRGDPRKQYEGAAS
eukprot:TRINITY_DN4599_c0_g2_i1.p1 TRINITY_DN4599_c0_g2~~TRINITY_DN4599_c0_g2_i1.p1  ORF type:complete len:331 (+),score=74.93 TRINITY_DN4599_c0_g2_i1:114-1106(+)